MGLHSAQMGIRPATGSYASDAVLFVTPRRARRGAGRRSGDG